MNNQNNNHYNNSNNIQRNSIILNLKNNPKLVSAFPIDEMGDITIVYKNKKFQLQKQYIEIHSEYIKRLFKPAYGLTQINIGDQNFSENAFNNVIHYMYGKPLNICISEAPEYLEIFKFLEMYQVQKDIDDQYKGMLYDLELNEIFQVLNFLLYFQNAKKSLTRYIDKISALLYQPNSQVIEALPFSSLKMPAFSKLLPMLFIQMLSQNEDPTLPDIEKKNIETINIIIDSYCDKLYPNDESKNKIKKNEFKGYFQKDLIGMKRNKDTYFSKINGIIPPNNIPQYNSHTQNDLETKKKIKKLESEVVSLKQIIQKQSQLQQQQYNQQQQQLFFQKKQSIQNSQQQNLNIQKYQSVNNLNSSHEDDDNNNKKHQQKLNNTNINNQINNSSNQQINQQQQTFNQQQNSWRSNIHTQNGQQNKTHNQYNTQQNNQQQQQQQQQIFTSQNNVHNQHQNNQTQNTAKNAQPQSQPQPQLPKPINQNQLVKEQTEQQIKKKMNLRSFDEIEKIKKMVRIQLSSTQQPNNGTQQNFKFLMVFDSCHMGYKMKNIWKSVQNRNNLLFIFKDQQGKVFGNFIIQKIDQLNSSVYDDHMVLFQIEPFFSLYNFAQNQQSINWSENQVKFGENGEITINNDSNKKACFESFISRLNMKEQEYLQNQTGSQSNVETYKPAQVNSFLLTQICIYQIIV